MPELYTTSFGNITRNVGSAYMGQAKEAQMKELTKSAYMGDPQAMAELTAIHPQAARQIHVSQRQQKVDALSMEDRGRTQSTEKQDILSGILQEAAKLPTFAEAQSYAARETAARADVLGEVPPLAEEAYNQVRKIGLTKPAASDLDIAKTNKAQAEADALGDPSSFEGTGMDAQVSNILIKGTQDPEYLKSPEYARAWQLANEPKIVRTPQGDMILRPELPAGFKPPVGSAKAMTPEEQSAAGLPAPQPGAPKVAFIPGTEKLSVDQKAYNKDNLILQKSYSSMTNYQDVLKELGPQMSVGPLNAADTQKLKSAFNRAMLDAKETNNLGVLNGPDLTIMANFLGDPVGAGGIIQGKEALLIGADQALKQITDNQASLNSMVEGSTVKTKALSSGADKKGITANDANMSMTVNGKVWTFPDLESYNAAKAAAEI